MKTKSLIIIITLLTISIGLAWSTTKYTFIESHYSLSDTTKFSEMTFRAFDSTSSYSSLLVNSKDWFAPKTIFGSVFGVKVGTNLIDFNNFHYRQIKVGLNEGTLTTDYLFEIVDTSLTTGHGFIFSEPGIKDSLATPSWFNTFAQDIIDSLNANHVNGGTIPAVGTHLHKSLCYIVSYDQSDPFANDYTQAELQYEVYFDDGDDKFEVIRDIDRQHEIVGFRFLSNTNSSTVTKFIKPNN